MNVIHINGKTLEPNGQVVIRNLGEIPSARINDSVLSFVL